ncbi:MAG: hypothetical protein HXX16_06265 [Bacteroidales bacterium]|nr:hypothetical protein [Bacteroidales bacterium]
MGKFNTNRYINCEMSEIMKIKPLWAIDENVGFLLDKALHPNNDRFVFKIVKTKRLIECSDFKEVDIRLLYTGDDTNDNRISQILYCWDNGIYLDPPTIYAENINHKVMYSDGRHRVKVSYFLEFENIPVALEKDDLKIMNLLLGFDQ